MPEPTPWPYPAPEPPCGGGQCSPDEVFNSPDGTRAVWIQGDARDAYLYDRTGDTSFQPVFLDWDVNYVDFTSNDDGSLAAIVLTRGDGQTESFDPWGNPIDSAQMQIQSKVAGKAAAAAAPSRDLGKPLNASPAFQSLLQGAHWD